MTQMVNFDQREIGPGAPCYLIAEVGTTCLGNMDMALDLVAAGATAGADAVKFQVIDPGQVSNESDRYTVQWDQGETSVNMREMFTKLQFSPDQWRSIKAACVDANVAFLATVDYESGVDMLEEIGIAAHKIGAWDTTFKPLITQIGKTGKPMIVDLGPTSQSEIDQLMDWYAQSGGSEIIFLHDFHTPDPDQMNMAAIQHLKNTLPWPVGYSSPGLNDDLDFLALGIGVDVIEKRLIMDRSIKAFHSHESLEPDEFKSWVDRVRFSEQALGVAEIKPSEKDIAGSQLYYRSICTTQAVVAGELFTRQNLSGKRPGTGIPTVRLEEFWGRHASRDIKVDTLLTESELE
jgi:sialic acid synthase SpsE